MTSAVTADLPLFTGRFRDVHEFLKTGEQPGFVPVRSSLGVPRFIANAQAWPYASTTAPYGLRGIGDQAEFRKAYRHRLHKIGIDKVYDQIATIAADYPGQPLVLLCYEDLTKGEWCHRTLFAEWWFEKTGQQIPEMGDYPIGKPVENPYAEDAVLSGNPQLKIAWDDGYDAGLRDGQNLRQKRKHENRKDVPLPKSDDPNMNPPKTLQLPGMA